MNPILNIILKNTYTVFQFKRRLKLLQSYYQQKFFQAATVEILPAQDTEWFNSLPKSFADSFNKNNLSENLTNLINKINTMPVVTLYLPFEANEETLDQIGIKVRSFFGPTLLLDIKYNPVLIAGCALSWKGIYKDYSLRSRIDEKKPVILESFKKFLR